MNNNSIMLLMLVTVGCASDVDLPETAGGKADGVGAPAAVVCEGKVVASNTVINTVGGGFVYWVDLTEGFSEKNSLMRKPTAGGEAVKVKEIDDAVVAMVADATHVYFAVDQSKVYRLAHAGGEIELVEADAPAAAALALDDGQIAWATPFGVMFAKKDLSAREELPSSAKIREPQALAIDTTHIYWIPDGSEGLRRTTRQAPFKAEELSQPGAFVTGVTLNGDAVYWADPFAGKVRKMAKNSRIVTDLDVQTDRVMSIKFDATTAYVTGQYDEKLELRAFDIAACKF